MNKYIPKKLLINEIKIVQDILDNLHNLKNFDLLCKKSLKAIKKKNKIIFFGNGGSAADAQHLATELTVRYQQNREAIPALALTTDVSAITAIGNDFNFKYIFSRQIEAIGNKGDIVIALTTSGNSLNLIEACKVAKKKKILTFCFSGNKGGKIKKIVDHAIIIPSRITSAIQVVELLIGQILCSYLEKNTS